MRKTITICDICEKEKPVFNKWNDEDCCSDCYYDKTKHIPQHLIDDWGEEMAEKLYKFDAFTVINYEQFNYPEEDAVKFAGELNEIFKKLKVDITAIPDNDDENSIIGFMKKK